jgi:hypothetical protein
MSIQPWDDSFELFEKHTQIRHDGGSRRRDVEEGERISFPYCRFTRPDLKRRHFFRTKALAVIACSFPPQPIQIQSVFYKTTTHRHIRAHCAIFHHGCPQVLQMDEREISSDLTVDRRKPNTRIRLSVSRHERHHPQLYTQGF